VSSPKLSPPPGSKKTKKRLGRGYGSGLGKTAGRGTKGQGVRAGSKQRAWFEGGQMPLQRRVPKRGFKPIDRTEFQIVNLANFSKLTDGTVVTPEEMAARGWIKNSDGLVKILGEGEIGVKVELSAHAISKSALEKLQKAGGKFNLIPRFNTQDASSAKTAPSRIEN